MAGLQPLFNFSVFLQECLGERGVKRQYCLILKDLLKIFSFWRAKLNDFLH